MYAFVHLPLCLCSLCLCLCRLCEFLCLVFLMFHSVFPPLVIFIHAFPVCHVMSVMSASLSPLCTFMFLRSLSSAFCPLLCRVPQFLVLLGKSCDSMYGVLPLWHHVNLCHLCSLSVLTSLVVLFCLASKSLNLGPILPALHTVHDITVMVLGR